MSRRDLLRAVGLGAGTASALAVLPACGQVTGAPPTGPVAVGNVSALGVGKMLVMSNVVVARDASGMLYWARYAEMGPGDYVSEIRTINTITGQATLVAPIGDDAPQINALSVGSAGDCSLPDDVPWLSIAPTSGTTAAGDVSYATLTLDAGGLTTGVYHATVCVIGNDGNTPVQEFPIELVIIDASDVVFRNGFDGD